VVSIRTGAGANTDVEGSNAFWALYVWWVILKLVVATSGPIVFDRPDILPVASTNTGPAEGKGRND